MKHPEFLEIDIGKYGGPVYIGREKGKAIRDKFGLDSVDSSETRVCVLIPDNTYSINSSYFLSLFGPSIRAAGSRDAFLDKYEFRGPPSVWETIDSCISRALHEKTALFDKNK